MQERLLAHVDGAITFLGAAGFCLSEEADLLSQWRGYADDGTGVSIGFSRKYFELLGNTKRDRGDEFNASITKVEYDYSKQRASISEPADKIVEFASKGAFTPLSILMATDDEKEKRRKLFREAIGQFLYFIFDVYAMKNPAFVPFRKIPLEKLEEPSIVEIVLGPKNITPKPVLVALLEKHGWADVSIKNSSASYR